MFQSDEKFADKFVRCKFFKIDEKGEAVLTVFISDEKWEDSFAMISFDGTHLMMFAESENYDGERKNRSVISSLKTKLDFGELNFSEIELNSVSYGIKHHLMDIWSNTLK